MDYKQMYEQLQQEFEQYKKESIKWSVYDFLDYDTDDYTIDEVQSQDALETMIKNHNAEFGVTWHEVEYYIKKFGNPKK
jgi:hypothetical protein